MILSKKICIPMIQWVRKELDIQGAVHLDVVVDSMTK